MFVTLLLNNQRIKKQFNFMAWSNTKNFVQSSPNIMSSSLTYFHTHVICHPYKLYYPFKDEMCLILYYDQQKMHSACIKIMKCVCFIWGLGAYCTVKHSLAWLYKTNLLMLHRAKIAVCSEICTQHTNAMWAPCGILEC